MLNTQTHTGRKLPVNLGLFVALCIFVFISYTTIMSPIARVPKSYILENTPREVLEAKGPATRGSLEARRTHKPHAVGDISPYDMIQGVPLEYTKSRSGLPLANYAAIIDAGSSGSRIYVYQFKLPDTSSTSPDPTAQLLHMAVAEDYDHTPIVRKQEPGLSAFSNAPHRAFSSIEPLLQYASSHIPPLMLPHTPIYVYATAGLRLIPTHAKDAILQNIRHGLREWSKQGRFTFESDDQADVISGEDEGIYGWVALNYIKNRFGELPSTYPTGGLDPHTYAILPRVTKAEHERLVAQGNTYARIVVDPDHVRTPTSGLLEIGGGSSQIAFEASSIQDLRGHADDYFVTLDLDASSCGTGSSSTSVSTTTNNNKPSHKYLIYAASLLGYGVNAARSRYVQALLSDVSGDGANTKQITDPCLLHNQVQIVSKKNPWGKSIALEQSKDITALLKELKDDEYIFIGSGNWDSCRERILPLLEKQSPKCKHQHCAISDVYQPKLSKDLLQQTFYGFSEYWFTTRDVLGLEPSKFSARLLSRASKALCDGEHGLQRAVQGLIEGKFPSEANEKRIREQCFKSAWVDALLFDGHGVPRDIRNPIVPLASMEGAEVQWTLGALLVKMTEKVKNNEYECKRLKRGDAVNNAYATARDMFHRDEVNRLATPDYWGAEASWSTKHYFATVAVVLMVAFSVLMYCIRSEAKNNLHEYRRETNSI